MFLMNLYTAPLAELALTVVKLLLLLLLLLLLSGVVLK